MQDKNKSKLTNSPSNAENTQSSITISKCSFDQIQWQREVIKEELVEDLQRQNSIRKVI